MKSVPKATRQSELLKGGFLFYFNQIMPATDTQWEWGECMCVMMRLETIPLMVNSFVQLSQKKWNVHCECTHPTQCNGLR